jgi:superfamily II DNA or RNA helicase
MGYGGAKSKRTERMWEAMNGPFTHFLGLTGTIINGRLSSAYPAIKVIEPDMYFSYETFMYRHAIEVNNKVVAWMEPERLVPFFRKYAVRHSFVEVYGPEAKVVINELCEMDPAQRAAYEEFETQGILELEQSFLDGSLPGVSFIRCRQLMEHPQTFGAPLDCIKHTGKEQRLLVHLENAKQSGKPLLIFAVFQPQQDRLVEICKSMGFRTGLINGTVSTTKRGEIDEKFQTGEIDIVVASPATASVGFNWGHLDTVIFMSIDFMDSSFLQGYRRAMRGVRTSPLLIYVMEYEDSVDQRIFQIVETKSKLAVAVDETQVSVQLKAKPKPLKIFSANRKRSMSDYLQ